MHSHPAIERAFFGHLIWGTAVDDAPVNAGELPAIAPCPVETHDRDATSPIDRAVGEQLFPQVAGLTGFAHGPVGSVDYRATSAWPNARDVIHQQMNIASIRRAYEGGLRLMFASTTDDQVIAALLTGPNLDDAFVPTTGADYDSARQQIDLIQSIVAQNSPWMGIARTPSEARAIINSGRLALVLSLEMEGLREEDVDKLRDDFGVRHIIPIHLIDNDIGGTAANGDLFNAASAEVSQIYRSDHATLQYMNLAASPSFDHVMGLPKQLGTLSPPVYAQLDDVPYSLYSMLCYEPLEGCSKPIAQPADFIEQGQVNARGLCSTLADCANPANPRPGSARIQHLIDTNMLVDVSHMSMASVRDTLAVVAAQSRAYPIMASHGDVAHLCIGNPKQPPCVDDSTFAPGSERSIEGEYARQIVDHGGVLGLGTGMKAYAARDVLAARGGPLFTLSAGAPRVSFEPAARLTIDPAATVATIDVKTLGGITSTVGNAQPFVRVEMRANTTKDSYQRHVFEQPLTCSALSCVGSVALPMRDEAMTPGPTTTSACAPLDCGTAGACGSSPYTVDDIQSVTLEWLYLGCDLDCQKHASGVTPRQCQSTWDDDRAPHWTIDRVDVSASGLPIASLANAPVADLGKKRGALVAYDRDDRPETALSVPASGRLLKVSMRSSQDSSLLGASPDEPGANVCFAIREKVNGQCVSTAQPLPVDATDCTAASGWWNLNQRGEWASGVTLFAFARFPDSDDSICGLDVSVIDWQGSPSALDVDEMRIEAIEDPLGRWVRRYAELAKQVANGQLGAFAFGTDFNGLNGVMDISELPLPANALAASACPIAGTGTTPTPLAPMRFRNADGSLGGEVRIDERGLGTYGLLADFVAIVAQYPGCGGDVHDSLMLSAEATLRAWERIVDPQTAAARPPLPTRPFACLAPP